MSDRCQRALDDCIVEGWDRGGIHCWSSHSMESLGFIEERSEHIALIDRTFSDGSVSTFNFRRYINKDGQRRFVMLCIDDSEVVHDGAPLRIWITDGGFFRAFCESMSKCGEIDDVDFEILIESIG